MDFTNIFLKPLTNFDWRSFLGVSKYFIIFLDIILVVAFFYSLKKSLELRPDLTLIKRKLKPKESLVDKVVTAKHWEALLKKSEANPPQSFVFAIIEADKFTDNILKKLGYEGEHMADRLARLNDGDVKSLPKLWRVHRVRNDLVHTPDFEINAVDAKEILEVYEKFLKELQVL